VDKKQQSRFNRAWLREVKESSRLDEAWLRNWDTWLLEKAQASINRLLGFRGKFRPVVAKWCPEWVMLNVVFHPCDNPLGF
jgi:hypothetical protein